MGKLVSVGKILNFHGIRGEVKIGFTAGKESLIKKLKSVFVYVNNDKVKLDVQSVRFHKNFAIIKFQQINSVNDVLEIKGLLIHVDEDILKASLQEDEFLITDLVGLNVFDIDGNEIGTVTDLGDNKASDLIQIKKANGLVFVVPFVKELVPVVDIKNKKLIIKMLEGLDTTISQKEES